MKALTRICSTIHALMALRFACAAPMLTVNAAAQAWPAVAAGLNREAA